MLPVTDDLNLKPQLVDCFIVHDIFSSKIGYIKVEKIGLLVRLRRLDIGF